jgi:hypothetical protein
VAKCSIHFEEILAHTQRNFEDLNKFLESATIIIIISYLIVIVNVYRNYIIHA